MSAHKNEPGVPASCGWASGIGREAQQEGGLARARVICPNDISCNHEIGNEVFTGRPFFTSYQMPMPGNGKHVIRAGAFVGLFQRVRMHSFKGIIKRENTHGSAGASHAYYMERQLASSTVPQKKQNKKNAVFRVFSVSGNELGRCEWSVLHFDDCSTGLK